MLVLTIERGSRVLVDDEIEIRIIDVHGKRVRLGFSAPDHRRILREELMAAPPKPTGHWATQDE
jgi:carbon storage regulator CsrA